MLAPLPPGVDGEPKRFEGWGDAREEEDSEMLLFPPPPPPFPPETPSDLFAFGVDGAGLPLGVEDPEGRGGVPALPALASRAAFWLFLPNGDMAAADGLFGAGEGILRL